MPIKEEVPHPWLDHTAYGWRHVGVEAAGGLIRGQALQGESHLFNDISFVAKNKLRSAIMQTTLAYFMDGEGDDERPTKTRRVFERYDYGPP